ncbi:hypothetical protein LJC08_02545 [Methanimicrococcus sp. OttesenSCG-928-J09]|nr:hypothetical protein [Methanimicrococcus sp. OttesenSCG-928-J09]
MSVEVFVSIWSQVSVSIWVGVFVSTWSLFSVSIWVEVFTEKPLTRFLAAATAVILMQLLNQSLKQPPRASRSAFRIL